MKKTVFYTELAFFVGLALLAFGTALTAYGDVGISMVVAPAFILHLYVSQFLPWFTFGVAEYVLQAVVLLTLILVLRKVKWTYFLSFGATLLYGFALDASMKLTALLSQRVAVPRGGVIPHRIGQAVGIGRTILLVYAGDGAVQFGQTHLILIQDAVGMPIPYLFVTDSH